MFKNRQIRSFTFITIVLGLFMSTSVYANRTIALRIINTEEVPVTYTIKSGSCYEPYSEGLDGTKKSLAPNENFMWKLNRVQGSDCDGENGYFSVMFDPAPAQNTTNIIKFTYDNEAHLSTDATQVNAYPGRLELASPGWYNYYTSGLMKKITASRAVGMWKSICIEVCNLEKTKTISKEASKREGLDTNETSAISVSLTLGVEMGGMSAESNITSSYEKSVGRSMETAFSEGETNTDLNKFIFTPEEMNQYNFHSIWQWVVPMKLSNGKSYLVRSNHVACATGHEAPIYAPEAKQLVGSCSGALAK